MLQNIDLKKYKAIHDIIPRTFEHQKKFACKCCYKKLSSLHAGHFNKCAGSKDLYLEQYGFPNQFYEKNYIYNLITEKLFNLYVSYHKKYLIINQRTGQYCTVTDTSINSLHIKKHLSSKYTLGVFPLEHSSKFMAFDIDCHSSPEDAKPIIRKIRKFLLKIVPSSEIHIVYSGNNGYHIELYFERYIEITIIEKLFNIVLTELNIEKYKNINVELRPESKGIFGRGLKLPCGNNFTNRDNHNNYSYFCHLNFAPVEYEIEYILSISKTSESVIKDFVTKYFFKNEPNDYHNAYHPTIDCKANSVENLDTQDSSAIKCILPKDPICVGTRHEKTFKYSLYLKEEGYSEEESYNILLEWSLFQSSIGATKSSEEQISRDIKYTLKFVYNPSKKYFLWFKNLDVKFYECDMKLFENLHKVGIETNIRVDVTMHILYALIFQSKRYADSTGEFYCTYNRISKITGIKNTKSIAKHITLLNQFGLISIIKRNEYPKEFTQNPKKIPNIYIVNFVNEKSSDKVFTVTEEKDYLYQLFDFFYHKNLHKIASRKIRLKINKLIKNTIK